MNFTKKDIKAVIYLILLLAALAVLPAYDEKTAPKFIPDNTPPGTPMYI